MGILRLKDFIRQIRSCKTQADERAVIAKESAAIRTSLKEDTTAPLEVRHNNIAKMLYIHMLGYPTHYGQIECLKLVAAGKYVDKRLGYLGIMLLLDESQEVLTLVTNSLKNDMNSPNMFTVGLALATFGNIASSEMSRDLAPEVERLMSSSNSYIKKKAILCAVKVVKKVPDLADQFVVKAKHLLNEKNHAVLLTSVTLCITLAGCSDNILRDVRGQIPILCRHLKSLMSSAGGAAEHDVGGINDPFLQVMILRLLRTLGKGDRAASDSMNDVLAQIATNTDGNKNVGNSILYECCLTIMNIDCDSSLRTLAINMFGKFLGNTDNNVRYVALNTLNEATEYSNAQSVQETTNAIQRHRTTVLECLHDNDISIRRRALNLSFKLVTQSNVRLLVRELLLFLELPTTDAEFKQWMPARICAVAEQYAPNRRWFLDTVLRVLKLAGNYLGGSDVLSNFIKVVGNLTNPNAPLNANASDPSEGEMLRSYVVQKLFWLCKNDLSQEGLVIAAVWCIGEYGEILLKDGGKVKFALDSNEGEDANSTSPPQSAQVNYSGQVQAQNVSENDVLNFLQSVLESPYCNNVMIEYSLTALLKFTNRCGNSAASIERVKSLMGRYVNKVALEVQSRSCEYLSILGRNGVQIPDQAKALLLEHVVVPLPQVSIKPTAAVSTASTSSSPVNSSSQSQQQGGSSQGSGNSSQPSKQNTSSNIDDLLSLAF
ncbi:hypothetical protein MP228_008923 [Amoeboaphelidium protococcarum]|nr:hypothetical protein MP228_008923 [Amoeboaphelidium protococcarum]